MPTVSVEVGNPICGDMMSISSRVADDASKDISFPTFGVVPPSRNPAWSRRWPGENRKTREDHQ